VIGQAWPCPRLRRRPRRDFEHPFAPARRLALANDNTVEGQLGRSYGVDESKLINPLKEEKQKYFGPYADKDFQKGKKPVALPRPSLPSLDRRHQRLQRHPRHGL
jgi:hypothetical protein